MKKIVFVSLLFCVVVHNISAKELVHEHVEQKTTNEIVNGNINFNFQELSDTEKENLLSKAKEVRENAYVPYSKFKVGAAVLTEDGKIFTGCNVENASFGLTICAERCAIFKAVSEGYTKFKAIAVTLDDNEPGRPCGACRQVIREFGKDIIIIMSNLNDDIDIEPISNLLPKAFALDQK